MTVGAGIRVHAGLSGAGKTHGIRQEVWEHLRAGKRVVVIDRMREWGAVPPDIASMAAGIRTGGEGITAEQIDQTGKPFIVIVPQLSDVGPVTEEVCRWACASPDLRGIALPEAHRAIPKVFRPDDREHQYLQNVITEWRHHNVALWCDTQRFAKLNTDVVELARVVRLFAMSGKNDLKTLRDVGGKELETAVKEVAGKLDGGEPGWHVLLGVRRAGPYEITRE